ncbi:putative salivary glue protein Sgs-3 [Ixodes scapularis]
MIGDPVTQTAKEQVATEEPAEAPTTLLLTSTGPTIQTAVTQDPQITEVQATGPTSSQPLGTEAPITAAESTEESTPQIPTTARMPTESLCNETDNMTLEDFVAFLRLQHDQELRIVLREFGIILCRALRM